MKLLFRHEAAVVQYGSAGGTAFTQLQHLDYTLLSKVIYLDFPYPLMNCKYINRKDFFPQRLYNF